MSNYYIYYVYSKEANEYLNGTNYVGVWAANAYYAHETMKRYFTNGLFCRSSKEDARLSGMKIGFLY